MLKTRTILPSFIVSGGLGAVVALVRFPVWRKQPQWPQINNHTKNTLDFTENVFNNGTFGLFLGTFIQAKCIKLAAFSVKSTFLLLQ